MFNEEGEIGRDPGREVAGEAIYPVDPVEAAPGGCPDFEFPLGAKDGLEAGSMVGDERGPGVIDLNT